MSKNTKYIMLAPTYFCHKTIIGADRLNFRVRDGIECNSVARGTNIIYSVISQEHFIPRTTMGAGLILTSLTSARYARSCSYR